MDTALGADSNGRAVTAAATEPPVGSALREESRPDRGTAAAYQRIVDADRGTGGESLANFLGAFSIGLGLAEFLAPYAINKVIGVKHPDDRSLTTTRLMGLREIGHGLAILGNQQPAKAVWSRVAGDALDLALLGRTMANPDNDRGRTAFAVANVLAVTALDVMCARELSRQPRTATHAKLEEGIVVTRRGVTVNRPVEECWAAWRDLQRLPTFMRHLESVTELDARRSHWVAKAPAGRTVEWDAEIVEEREHELLAWRSVEGAQVRNAGRVTFHPAPGGRGTELRVQLEYEPPGGKLGSKVAMLWREEPGQQVKDDLRHFKQVMETGEVLFSDATKRRGPHPAQPDDKPAQL
ncbi:SRPBCC family protein [Roseisolibacter sp. H3M3-2]|uniref:SRPBCC family protein n=1 Tax=Roseisolibacter sp. H3M3-2 TaxID=3031323 RepID=UPI0023D988E9|nr:SRPBCC family protein [Roseisolibacter sp. H3M3-2]MDF1503389.1 SRPBCC family protein [Roseisolibacter sp. H3M3-2]